MENWIKRMAEEYAAPSDETSTSENTQLSVLLASKDIDVSKMYKLLSTNGFPVLDIRVQETNENQLPTLEAGDRVTTTASVSLGNNIMIKTPTMLYSVAKAVLPVGYIGEVVNTTKTSATVLFDANIKVTATDREGYTDAVEYYVETAEVPLSNLKKIV